MKPKEGNFRVRCVVEFEIDPQTAAILLADKNAPTAVATWLETQSPKPDEDGITNYHIVTTFQECLGKFLAKQKVAEVKQLAATTGPIEV